MKKTSVLGLVTPTVSPVSSDRRPARLIAGARRASAARASARCRIAWNPSQTTYAAPTTFTTV